MSDVRITRTRSRPGVAGGLAWLMLVTTAAAQSVRTESGMVQGRDEAGVLVFKGIPFAAPPIGDRRWRPPAPPAPWQGVRQADRFSPICPQPGSYPDDAPSEPKSEDCLYLNIWRPAGSSSTTLPVMVWFHGGGLLNGSASTPLYAGHGLARRGVIVVTFNYRLGILGFLALPDLTRESDRGVSGNYGLLDQLAALGWVRRNIAAFGGDPDNVTVFGQSSGSIAISALLVSPLARGLFRRAIGQSGGLFEPVEAAPEFALPGAERVGVQIMARLGAPTVAALRAAPVDEIVAARFSPQPVIDGYVLPEPPFQAHASGRVQDVDLLVGSTEGEGWYFAEGRRIEPRNLTTELRRDFPGPIVSLLGPAPPAADREALAAFVGFEGRMRFGWNMWAWARLHAARGRGRTFAYRFGKVPPGAPGSSHGAELAYVFGRHAAEVPGWRPEDARLGETMVSYWVNFAARGDPNGPGLPRWPAFTVADRHALLIGDRLRTGPVPDEAGLRSIDRLYGAIRGVLRYRWWLVGGIGAGLALAGWMVGRRLFRAMRLRVPRPGDSVDDATVG